ncbi:adenosylmethionine decarboxylase [uncultured Fretibacterium sp.]|uniref:adenosylmethionine decarboxylase n=1 Tax=uncultured Fretibacterium sp. TaxID=1678694 RepID=UPI0026206CB3|nr:adenosylmethionine decarboxylase [uncultured Fretibacterium sp.]
MSPKGVHFIVEASGCGEVITDVVRLQDILVEAAKQANAQVWSVSFNRFPPNGVSGVVVISESHLSVHTWPEVNYMALDIYTCGANSKPFKAVEYVLKTVEAKRSHITEITRGLDDDDQVFYHSFITWEEILRKNGDSEKSVS